MAAVPGGRYTSPMMRFRIFAALLAGYALLGWIAPGAAAPAGADACRCTAVEEACLLDGNAAAIFVARVQSMADAKDGRREAALQVLERLAGAASGTLAVRTRAAGDVKDGDCGVDFQVGETWLVYARRASDGTLQTSRCAGTVLAATAAEKVTSLRQEALLGQGTVLRIAAYTADSAAARSAMVDLHSDDGRIQRLQTNPEGYLVLQGMRAGTHRIVTGVEEIAATLSGMGCFSTQIAVAPPPPVPAEIP